MVGEEYTGGFGRQMIESKRVKEEEIEAKMGSVQGTNFQEALMLPKEKHKDGLGIEKFFEKKFAG